MTDHIADIRKYTSEVDEKAVTAIVKYCGIALQKVDSSLVAASDPKELETVRNGFAVKKLGLTPEAADQAIKEVVAKMKDDARKDRVTFYYLLAQSSGALGKLS